MNLSVEELKLLFKNFEMKNKEVITINQTNFMEAIDKGLGKILKETEGKK